MTVDKSDTSRYHRNMPRQMIQFTEPQLQFLRAEALTLGVSVSELVRRVLDEHRAKKDQEHVPGIGP